MSTRHGRLKKIEGHPYYFRDPVSERIAYIKKYSGRTIKISTGEITIQKAKAKAEAELIKRFSENPNKEFRAQKGIRNPLLKDIWKELLEEKATRDPGTKATYNTSWGHGIEPFWGELFVADVTQSNVNKFEQWYLRENSTRSFYNTRKHLIMLFNFLKSNGYISMVPEIEELDETIDQKTGRVKPGRVYTDAEIEEILRHSTDRLELAVLMARFMGMRHKEIRSREWANVSFKDSILSVWSFKNKKWRKVPIPNRVMKKLQSFKEASRGKLLFPKKTNDKEFLPSQMLDKEWKRAQELAGIDGWDRDNEARFHDLRHTFATMTARENWPPMVACKVLDMSLLEYERTYVHITDDDMIKWMNRSGTGHTHAR